MAAPAVGSSAAAAAAAAPAPAPAPAPALAAAAAAAVPVWDRAFTCAAAAAARHAVEGVRRALDEESPLPRLGAANDNWCQWGRGPGLSPFSDRGVEVSERHHAAAALWRELLLEGAVGSPSLMATHGSTAPTFVDCARADALAVLAPRLTALDSGELSGQANCFVLLGARGVGKSHFLKSLAHVVARAAQPTTCAIYVNFKRQGVMSLFAAIRAALTGAGLAAPPASADGAGSALHRCLLAAGRRVFLVVDGVEELYKRDDDVAGAVWRELHFIGDMTGRRTIMAVITGSAAVLRALVFSQRGYDAAARDYPRYLRLSSLNDRKFLPLTLKPLTAASEVRRAMLCVASGAAWQRDALETGVLCAPAGYVPAGDGAPAEALSAAFGVCGDAVKHVQLRTRGLVSWMSDVMAGAAVTEHLFYSHLRNEVGRAALGRLYTAWETSVSAGCAVAEAERMLPTLCGFQMDLPYSDADASVWYQLMDKGVLHFREDGPARFVSFLHPSDVGACLLAFRRDHVAGALSAAEQLSLLAPQLASAASAPSAWRSAL